MKIEQLYQLFIASTGISTDTRKIKTGCLFFALKGDQFNGNVFAQKALEQGAAYCIIDEEINSLNEHYIIVDDVLQTLQQLATFHRMHLGLPVIALTGSNGKTTTKELINAVLAKKFKTSATVGNLNNHIGVPLTLLKMDESTEIGIVEMGANHLKEIATLSRIALPDYGLITNFGKAHIEGFGSVEGVIQGKSELYDYLIENNKTIFINGSDAIQIQQTLGYERIVVFGSKKDGENNLQLIATQPYVNLLYNGQEIKSHLTGAYNFNNISSAIAIGNYFEVPTEEIISAIENYKPTNNRSQIIKKGTNTIIMDAYNANPSSMKAALDNFSQLNEERKILFLGDMFELGHMAEIEHQQIADYLSEIDIDSAYLIGENFYKTKIDKNHILKFRTFLDLKEFLDKNKILTSFILIKGSRGMALERILEFI